MNREILFRGKRVDADGGDWVYGTPVFLKNGEARIFVCEDWIRIHVAPSTVGQYTGLKDRNGKRIFEGDIVESADFDDDSGYGVVQWADGAFQIGNDLFNGTFYDNYRGDEFEVIGNIHDNPELLREEAQHP